MLLNYRVKQLVSVMEGNKLSPRQLEGAARLLGGWDFSQTHPKGLDLVPPATKTLLWEHVKGTKDEDKLGRAKRAFTTGK